MPAYTLHLGDCLEVMPSIPSGSVDAIFTDPPYPYIKREYGYWTEETWLPMMQEVVRQGRRILAPHGSMVMVLQPNSEKVGKMRPWLWKFMVWCCEEWNIVQDAYWWNYTTIPNVHTQSEYGLMRPSVKYFIWLGADNCYRNQVEVLWSESVRNAENRLRGNNLEYGQSGYSVRHNRIGETTSGKGGVSPFNLLPIGNTQGRNGHGAGTPLKLADWWLRYISKPGDTVLDTFSGTATTGIAALKLGRKYIGIERMGEYHEVSQTRLSQVEQELREAQIAKERQPYLMETMSQCP